MINAMINAMISIGLVRGTLTRLGNGSSGFKELTPPSVTRCPPTHTFGEELEVLKLLLKSCAGRVKMTFNFALAPGRLSYPTNRS